MAKTVGAFTYDDGAVLGPADYMAERWPAFKAKLEAGQSSVFNYGAVGRDVVTAMLVAVQTDYAGWRGTRELLGGAS